MRTEKACGPTALTLLSNGLRDGTAPSACPDPGGFEVAAGGVRFCGIMAWFRARRAVVSLRAPRTPSRTSFTHRPSTLSARGSYILPDDRDWQYGMRWMSREARPSRGRRGFRFRALVALFVIGVVALAVLIPRLLTQTSPSG